VPTPRHSSDRPAKKTKKESKETKFSRLLKWVGYLTAILSLCATIGGIAKFGYERMKTRQAVDTLLSTEALQLQSHDYWAAWRTLEQAAQHMPNSPQVSEAQVSLAMTWLENIDLSQGQKFSDVTQKLEPVLTHAVAASKPGPRRADLRAHIGWTYFLASRDGRFDLDPAGSYAAAVAEDGDNPYARAMWGHWMLWQSCAKIGNAGEQFASAVASKRQGDFVRRLQLAALLNCNNEEASVETIRVANAMRGEQRSLDPWSRDHIFGRYYFALMNNSQSPQAIRFINAVPPAEHLATYRWLFDAIDFGDSNRRLRTLYLALLQEAAGQRDDALANYRSLLGQVQSHSGSLWQTADAAVNRLSRPH